MSHSLHDLLVPCELYLLHLFCLQVLSVLSSCADLLDKQVSLLDSEWAGLRCCALVLRLCPALLA